MAQSRIYINQIKITELPIGTWSENYKVFLETLVADDAEFLVESFFKDRSFWKLEWNPNEFGPDMKYCKV